MPVFRLSSTTLLGFNVVSSMGVSAVLPNYNGVELLREYLPSVLEALRP